MWNIKIIIVIIFLSSSSISHPIQYGQICDGRSGTDILECRIFHDDTDPSTGRNNRGIGPVFRINKNDLNKIETTTINYDVIDKSNNVNVFIPYTSWWADYSQAMIPWYPTK